MQPLMMKAQWVCNEYDYYKGGRVCVCVCVCVCVEDFPACADGKDNLGLFMFQVAMT